MRRNIPVFLGVLLMLGFAWICSVDVHGQNTHQSKKILSASEVERIAIDEVKKREKSDSLRVSSLKHEKEGWRVTVTSVPETPGGHCILTIADDGRVKSFQGGR